MYMSYNQRSESQTFWNVQAYIRWLSFHCWSFEIGADSCPERAVNTGGLRDISEEKEPF